MAMNIYLHEFAKDNYISIIFYELNKKLSFSNGKLLQLIVNI